MNLRLIIIAIVMLPLQLFGQERKLELLVTENIYFSPNSFSPDKAELTNLEQLYNTVKVYKNLKIKISSGTDSIGDPEENQKLSENRSRAVADFFQKKGIKNNAIEIVNLGENSPVADNGSEEGRRNNRFSKIEIFKAEIVLINQIRISSTLKDDETNQPIADSMVLVFHREDPDTVFTDKKGNFEILVPDSTKTVDLFVKDYFFVSLDIDKNKGKEIKADVPLKKAKIGNKANFDDINFYGGRAVMITGSYKTCDKIAKFLKYNPNRVVEIAGHVNVPNTPKVSTESWDFKLSEQRASRVCSYLTEKGIAKERLIAKGYGNWEMLFPNALLEEEQKKNRRVEVRIIK